jgi:hypothetical protein
MRTPPQGENWVAPRAWQASADSADVAGLAAESIQVQLQAKLESLQEWICELLIKNQQLRIAVAEMQAGTQGGDIDPTS